MVAVPPLGGSAFRLLSARPSTASGIKATGLLSLGCHAHPAGLGLRRRRDVRAGAGDRLAARRSPAPASRWRSPSPAVGTRRSSRASFSASPAPATRARSSPRSPRRASPSTIGWHATFGVAMVPVALCWVVFALLAKEPPKETTHGRSTPRARACSPRSTPAGSCVFYLVTFGGFVGLTGYLPIFFVDRFGLTPVTAASYAALCATAGSLLRPVGGAPGRPRRRHQRARVRARRHRRRSRGTARDAPGAGR